MLNLECILFAANYGTFHKLIFITIFFVFYSEMPGSGNIITFSQFLFIAIEGFIFTSKFGTVAPSIPMKYV